MIQMTFDQFDTETERIAALNNPDPEYWPDVKDLYKHVIPNPEKYLKFLIYLTETNYAPSNEKDKKSRASIQDILYENIELVD